MRILAVSLLLWGVISIQVFAMMESPIAEAGAGGYDSYRIELKSISYFYHLSIYDENHILLDSTIQFTLGHDLDAFLVENDSGNLEVFVVMSLDENTDIYDFFSFNGSFLAKKPV